MFIACQHGLIITNNKVRHCNTLDIGSKSNTKFGNVETRNAHAKLCFCHILDIIETLVVAVVVKLSRKCRDIFVLTKILCQINVLEIPRNEHKQPLAANSANLM